MTNNRLLIYTFATLTLYGVAGYFASGDYFSGAMSLLLLAFGGATLLRYLPEALRIVIRQVRNPSAPPEGDGAHLAVYGVALLSLGAFYSGAFGALWIWFGQPSTWLATPVSSFGRACMAAGFALLLFSPDVTRKGIRMPSSMWVMIVAIFALVAAFFVGLHMGRTEQFAEGIERFMACPSELPVKGNRSKIYHMPGDRFYRLTRPEACFASPQMAVAAGFRQARLRQ